jgi:hypothetical protein
MVEEAITGNKFSTVTSIDEALMDITGKDKTETVIKNLLEHKHLPFITELTFEQIVEICKLKHIAVKYGNRNFPKFNKLYPIEKCIDEFIENFTLYMTSHKRKRVGEFLDGLKGERDIKAQQPNFLTKFLNK